MSSRLEALLSRRYSDGTRPDSRGNMQRYNCWDFAVEAWKILKGQCLQLPALELQSAVEVNAAVATLQRTTYRRIDAATSPCIVLLRKSDREIPHVGVYYRGKMLHLSTTGAKYEPLALATRYFSEVWYYVPRDPAPVDCNTGEEEACQHDRSDQHEPARP